MNNENNYDPGKDYHRYINQPETQIWLDQYYYNTKDRVGYTKAFFEEGEVSFVNPYVKSFFNDMLISRPHPYCLLSRFFASTTEIERSFQRHTQLYFHQDVKDHGNYTFSYKEGGKEIVVDFVTLFEKQTTYYREDGNENLLTEFYRCNNSARYISFICEEIIREYHKCRKIINHSDVSARAFYKILLNQYRRIIHHLRSEYDSYIKTGIHNELEYISSQKDIKPFKLKHRKIQQIEGLESRFNELKVKKIVAPTTKIGQIYDLFGGMEIKEQINWTGNFSTLYTFIRLLMESDKINCPKGVSHWEVTASCFTCNGQYLDRSDFPHQHKTNDKDILKILKRFVNIL